MSGANLREYVVWIILSGMISWTVTCFTNKRECKVTRQEIEDKKLMYKRLLPRKQERKLRPRQHEQAITWQASGACACYSWRWLKLIVKQRYILYHMYGCFKTVQNVASSVIVYLRSWAQSFHLAIAVIWNFSWEGEVADFPLCRNLFEMSFPRLPVLQCT